jgi:hypothetical protein
MVRQPITDAEAARETQKALQRFFKNRSGPFPPIKSSPPRKTREGFKVITFYTRQKQNGKWRYERVKEGRGHKLANSVGPFYLRYSHEGRQILSAPIPLTLTPKG